MLEVKRRGSGREERRECRTSPSQTLAAVVAAVEVWRYGSDEEVGGA